jgi:hypothetical protein
MSTPTGAIEIGGNAYLFASPDPGMRYCFIVAHGSTPDTSSYRFNVPAGKAVLFQTEAGFSNRMEYGPVRAYRELIRQGRVALPATNRYEGGSCPDYILGKAVGYHWRDTGVQAEQSYSNILNAVRSDPTAIEPFWVPHFVTVRNRTSLFEDKNIWLSKLIELILKWDGQISIFICGNCRNQEEMTPYLIGTAGRQAYPAKG